jgi:hypothetical protein
MWRHWMMKSRAIVGIYREPARAAARREEEQGTRRDDGCEHDPWDEREVKQKPSDGIDRSRTCCRLIFGRSNWGGPGMHGIQLYILPDLHQPNSYALIHFL